MENKGNLYIAGAVFCGLASIIFIVAGIDMVHISVSLLLSLIASGCIYQYMLIHSAMNDEKCKVWNMLIQKKEDHKNISLGIQKNVGSLITLSTAGNQSTEKLRKDMQDFNTKVIEVLNQESGTLEAGNVLFKQLQGEVKRQNELLAKIQAQFCTCIEEVQNMVDANSSYFKIYQDNMTDIKESQRAKSKQLIDAVFTTNHHIETILQKQEVICKNVESIHLLPNMLQKYVQAIHKELQTQAEKQQGLFAELSEDLNDNANKVQRNLDNNISEINDVLNDIADSISESVNAIANHESNLSQSIEKLASQYEEFQKFTESVVKQLTDLSAQDQKYWKDLIE